MTDTETPMPTINSFYDNETSTEYAVEDTVARQRAEAAQDAAEEALAAAGEASDSVFETEPSWIARRSFYRGNNLGTVFTDEQKEAISSGTFDDIYIGDYWVVNNIKFRIMDINYIDDLEENHIVILPDSCLYSHQMNSSATSAGGYINTLMNNSGLNQALTIYQNFFGSDHIAEFTVIFSNGNSLLQNNTTTGVLKTTKSIILPNTIMLLGYSGFPWSTRLYPNKQLRAIFFNSKLITTEDKNVGTQFYWAQDIIDTATFTIISKIDGHIQDHGASNTHGVRPMVCVI